MVMYGHTYSKSTDQPSKVANSTRGHLNRKNEYFPVRVRAWEFGLARRVRQSRPASACSSPYSVRLNLVLTYGIPPEFRGMVHLNTTCPIKYNETTSYNFTRHISVFSFHQRHQGSVDAVVRTDSIPVVHAQIAPYHPPAGSSPFDAS